MKFFHVLFIMAVMIVGILYGVGAFISKDEGGITNLKLSKHNTFAVLHHDADSANSDISSELLIIYNLFFQYINILLISLEYTF